MRPSNVGWTLIVLSAAVVVRADEVRLKDGTRVEGLIISEGPAEVVIKTAAGETRSLARSEVVLTARTLAIGQEVIDARLLAIPEETPHHFHSVALWAKERGFRKEVWSLVAEMGLRAAAGDPSLRRLLGHLQVGDQWCETLEAAESARQALRVQELETSGHVRWRDGWIPSALLPFAEPAPGNLVKDQGGIYREKGQILKELGYVLAGGKWVRPATVEDRADRTQFHELLGGEIWPVTTAHFRLSMQQHPPQKVQECAQLLESVNARFLSEMGKGEDYAVFRGNRAHLLMLKDQDTLRAWSTHFGTRYVIADAEMRRIREGQVPYLCPKGLLGVCLASDLETDRHVLVHQAAHCLIEWFSPGLKGTPAWLAEAFAHHAEHVHLGGGTVTCVTLQAYATPHGVAEKKFGTQDARQRVKALVREGSDAPFENLLKLDFNSLNGDHLAQGWSIVSWLLEQHHDRLVAWLEAMNTHESISAFAKSFNGWRPEDLDRNWRQYVKTTY